MPEKDLAKNEAIRYRVTAESENPDTLKKFLRWIEGEHAADLLKVNGCVECRVYQISAQRLQCEYLFDSALDLQNYFDNEAEVLRAKSLALFGGESIEFSRDESSLLFRIAEN